ncbi:MAG: hypothetical protein NZ700_15675 [Gemmataceae bacterium]|nr:hypothetical protein [Gemmataceae bacterium]MDW8264015.1 hypothetical protein [Gemmataceae bacterium]
MSRSEALRARLEVELLEDRVVLSVLRIGAWNTANRPNSAEHEAAFKTVIQAIGNEVVQGTAKRLDILAVSETDTTSANILDDLFNQVYGTTSYTVTISAAGPGGDRTGFVYDTSTVSLLSSVTISGTFQHPVLRGQFRPVGTSGSADFYVYSIHLKSGATSSDATTRANEAAQIRTDADALGNGVNIIYVGDFNMHGSHEGAWTHMVAAGNGQASDAANAPGNWRSNSAFVSLHTQATTDMDDRFDLHFITGELLDGVGLDYVSGSFRAFGNNGTHGLDQPITAGTGAAPAVLNALVTFSDHLPVVADYRFNGSSGPAQVLFNEIYVDPPSTDDNREYVEIRSLNPSMTLTGYWLLEIDGDSDNPGVVDNAQNLSSLATGSNGLLLLGQNYATSHPWGSAVPAATTRANLSGGTMENGAITFLLVRNFTGSVNQDLDSNNDGVLDVTPWSEIVDSVAWTDGTAGDRVYTSTVLTLSGGAPHAATRFASNNTANSAAAWYYGRITGTGTTTTYDPAGSSANLPSGAVITPGASNYAPAPPPTKFFVVDTTSDSTYRYQANGTLNGSSPLASGNGQPRGIAADAAGTALWVIDANFTVYKYDTAGNLLGQWTASGLNTPEGIATDGSNIWIVDRGTDRVYYYAGGAAWTSGTRSAMSSFALVSGNTNPMGITTDGVSLWVVNSATTDRVYKYTTSGTHLGNWAIDPANSNPTGITIDPTNVNHIWIVDTTTDSVYQYNNAAGLTSGSLTASVVWALNSANGSPQGIADPPPLGGFAASITPMPFAAPPLARGQLPAPVADRVFQTVLDQLPQSRNWNLTSLGADWKTVIDHFALSATDVSSAQLSGTGPDTGRGERTEGGLGREARAERLPQARASFDRLAAWRRQAVVDWLAEQSLNW